MPQALSWGSGKIAASPPCFVPPSLGAYFALGAVGKGFSLHTPSSSTLKRSREEGGQWREKPPAADTITATAEVSLCLSRGRSCHPSQLILKLQRRRDGRAGLWGLSHAPLLLKEKTLREQLSEHPPLSKAAGVITPLQLLWGGEHCRFWLSGRKKQNSTILPEAQNALQGYY